MTSAIPEEFYALSVFSGEVMKLLSSLAILLLTAFTMGCGYSAPASTPAQAGVVPAIAQLVPNSATHGGAAFTLTVNGSNFATDAVINWNGTNLTTTYMAAGQLVGSVPASALSTAGTATVVVNNPAVSGGIYGGGTLTESSNSMTFTIN